MCRCLGHPVSIAVVRCTQPHLCEDPLLSSVSVETISGLHQFAAALETICLLAGSASVVQSSTGSCMLLVAWLLGKQLRQQSMLCPTKSCATPQALTSGRFCQVSFTEGLCTATSRFDVYLRLCGGCWVEQGMVTVVVGAHSCRLKAEAAVWAVCLVLT
jgi:hypothetical protein